MLFMEAAAEGRGKSLVSGEFAGNENEYAEAEAKDGDEKAREVSQLGGG